MTKYIYDRQVNPSLRPARFDHRKVNIVLHIRYGDTARIDPNTASNHDKIRWDIDPDVNGEESRRIPLTDGITVIHRLLDEDRSVLGRSDCEIHLFSEGDPLVFNELQVAYPNAVLHLGNGSTVFDDMDLMAQADILIGGQSSFTSFVAALNPDGVIIVPKKKARKDKFLGMNNTVRVEEILLGDVDEFNRMFCKSRLHVDRREVRFRRCKRWT
jgi:hypothetical protein